MTLAQGVIPVVFPQCAYLVSYHLAHKYLSLDIYDHTQYRRSQDRAELLIGRGENIWRGALIEKFFQVIKAVQKYAIIVPYSTCIKSFFKAFRFFR